MNIASFLMGSFPAKGRDLVPSETCVALGNPGSQWFGGTGQVCLRDGHTFGFVPTPAQDTPKDIHASTHQQGDARHHPVQPQGLVEV